MTTRLVLPSIARTPIAEDSGLLTPEWQNFFNSLYGRVGENDDALAEEGDVTSLSGRVTIAEADIVTIEADITAIETNITAIEADIVELQAAVQPPTYVVANGITLNDGTSASALSDLQTMLDGNTYDIAEVAGVPGISLEIDFTGVDSIFSVIVSASYVGLATHGVRIQLYDYTNTAWVTLDTIGTGTDQERHSIEIIDDTDFISSGAAIVRLYHTESGNASHDLYIDYVGIRE